MKRALVCVCCLLGIMGCEKKGEMPIPLPDPLSVTLSNVLVDNALDATFAKRNYYADRSGAFLYKPDQLVGRVLAKDPGSEEYRMVGMVLPPGDKPTLQMVSEAEAKTFEAVVDRGAEAAGSYLLFAANLKANEVARVFIRDVTVVWIDNADIPWQRIAQVAARPAVVPGTKRYWVQGAVLSLLTASHYAQVSGGSAVNGPAFGVDGKAYGSSKKDDRLITIALELWDIDELAGELAGPATMGESKAQRIEKFIRDPRRLDRVKPKQLKIVPRMQAD